MHCSFFFDLLFIRVRNRIALGLLSTLRGLGFVYIILATCPDCWSKPQAGNKLGSAWGRWSVSEPAARGSACICLSVSNKGRLDLLSTNALFPPLRTLSQTTLDARGTPVFTAQRAPVQCGVFSFC